MFKLKKISLICDFRESFPTKDEKGEVLFLLNHSKEEQEVVLEDNYLDLLDKDRIRKGETIKLRKTESDYYFIVH